jgi:hypothetical protein
MARHKAHIISQGKQTLFDGAQELSMIPTREICSPDRPREKDVSDKGQALTQVKKHHVSRCVAGAMQHLQGLFTNHYGIAVFKPPVRGKGVQCGKAKHLALNRQLVDPKGVVSVGPLNGHAKAVSQALGLSAMVDMAMGEQNLLHHDIELAGTGLEVINISTRINKGSPLGTWTNKQ